MPIYDQSYRHWEGDFRPRTFRWWIITKEGLKVILRNKLFLLFILTPPAITSFVSGALIYGVNVYGRLANLNVINTSFFYRFIMQQTFFISVICVFGGSGLISNDLKFNALQFYFSKPLDRLNYLIGKFLTIVLLMSFITLVPGILLFLENGLLSDLSFFRDDLWILGAIVLYSLIIILPTGLLILALSSTTKNSRYAAIIFATILIGTPILGETLREVLGIRNAVFVSYWRNLDIIGREIFALSNRYNWLLAIMIMMGIMGLSLWILLRNIKEIEIKK